MTPPLSSKSITPGSQLATPLSNPSRPGSTLDNIFSIYNPTSENKAKDRGRRTCISCYNRSDKKCNTDVDSCKNCLSKGIWCRAPIKTPNLFDTGTFDESVRIYLSSQPAAIAEETVERPSTCLLSISSPSSDVGSAPTTHNDTYHLDTGRLFEHHNPISHLSQLDPILDGHTQAMQATDTVERTTEGGYVDILVSSCRPLCSLLQALAHPTKNAITYTVDHTPYLPALACGVLRQQEVMIK
ncbi:hypothetical protein XPA_001727 [Xanthoria parietina]